MSLFHYNLAANKAVKTAGGAVHAAAFADHAICWRRRIDGAQVV